MKAAFLQSVREKLVGDSQNRENTPAVDQKFMETAKQDLFNASRMNQPFTEAPKQQLPGATNRLPLAPGGYPVPSEGFGQQMNPGMPLPNQQAGPKFPFGFSPGLIQPHLSVPPNHPSQPQQQFSENMIPGPHQTSVVTQNPQHPNPAVSLNGPRPTTAEPMETTDQPRVKQETANIVPPPGEKPLPSDLKELEESIQIPKPRPPSPEYDDPDGREVHEENSHLFKVCYHLTRVDGLFFCVELGYKS